MSEVPESVSRMAEAAERRRSEFESGARVRVAFSCGCYVEFFRRKCVGVGAGKDCKVDTPKAMRQFYEMNVELNG